MPDVSNGPQNASTLPASRNSEDPEQQLSTAQTRFALAEKIRLELAAKLDFAQCKKVKNYFAIVLVLRLLTGELGKKLNQEAELIEKYNLELQVSPILCIE
jgi:hypothetical protein